MLHLAQTTHINLVYSSSFRMAVSSHRYDPGLSSRYHGPRSRKYIKMSRLGWRLWLRSPSSLQETWGQLCHVYQFRQKIFFLLPLKLPFNDLRAAKDGSQQLLKLKTYLETKDQIRNGRDLPRLSPDWTFSKYMPELVVSFKMRIYIYIEILGDFLCLN